MAGQGTRASGPRAFARGRWASLAAALGLLVLAVVTVSLHVRAYPKLSPIDEMQHFDYLEKISRGERVRPGDRIGAEAMREESCRGIDAAFNPPPCGAADARPEQYQELGYSTAFRQTPVYYGVTGILARALRAALGLSSLLTAARLLGGLWLGAGLILLDLLMRELGAPAAARVIVPLLTVSTPVVLHASTTVNPDAVLLPFGAAVMLLLLRAERSPRVLWYLAAVGALAVFAEPTNILAVIAAAGYGSFRLLAGFYPRSPNRLRLVSRCLAGVSVLLAATALAFLLSSLLLESAGGKDPGLAVPKNKTFQTEHVGIDQIVGEMGSLVTPVQNAYLPPILRNLAVLTSIRLLNWLILGALLGIALVLRDDPRTPLLATAVMVTLAAGGPLFVAVNAMSNFYFAIPSRYGLPLLATAMALVGRSLQKWPAQVAVGLLSLLSVGGFLAGVLSP